MSPNRDLRLALFGAALASCFALYAQDYRSIATGNWNALTTWEQNNGSGWVAAITLPSNVSGAINIRSPHTVTVTANVNLDDVTIEAGGTVTTTATGTTNWTIANGTFGVKVFGTFNANASAGSFGCCGSVSVESGGVVNMNAGGAFFGPTTVQTGGTVLGNTPINLGAGALVERWMEGMVVH